MKHIITILVMISFIGCAHKVIKVPVVPAEVLPTNDVVSERIITKYVYFDFDSDKVKDVSQSVKDIVKDNKNVVDVVGYCDEVGTDEYNEWLGMRRASAVVKELDLSMVNISSKGKSEARHTDKDSERQMDRKVELIFR